MAIFAAGPSRPVLGGLRQLVNINALYLESVLASRMKSRDVGQGIVDTAIAFDDVLSNYVLQNGHECFQVNNSTQLYIECLL